jgi:hypothetical protein
LVSNVVLVEEDLPLQVAVFDEVPIDDAQKSNAGASKRFGENGAQRAAAAKEYAAFEEVPLSFFAELREAGLSAVAFEIHGRVGVGSRVIRRA